MPGNYSRALPPDSQTAGKEKFDDILNYDADGDIDDPFNDNYSTPAAKERAREAEHNAKSGRGLGIDEEVEVTRKRRVPRVKLDEDRLLSVVGIPKLRSKAKTHLKFKGRGHEYSDASKLLSFYQLWLDDLFPKAKFLDALLMVEKAGHKKRIQAMRMQWINEGKPHMSSAHEDSIFDQPLSSNNEVREGNANRIAPIFENRPSTRPNTPKLQADGEEEDLYSASPRPIGPEDAEQTNQPSIFGRFKVAESKRSAEEAPLEDELDALLAEEEILRSTPGNVQLASNIPRVPDTQENFEDEEEAMAEMDMDW